MTGRTKGSEEPALDKKTLHAIKCLLNITFVKEINI